MISKMNAWLTLMLTLLFIVMLAQGKGSVEAVESMDFVGKVWLAGFLTGFCYVLLEVWAKSRFSSVHRALILVSEFIALIALIISVFMQPLEWLQIMVCVTAIVIGYMNGSEYIPRAFGIIPTRGVKADDGD